MIFPWFPLQSNGCLCRVVEVTSAAPTSAPTMSLAEVGRVVGGWCDVTDPALYTGAEAAVAVEGLAKVVRRLQAKQAGFAARVEECHSLPRQFGVVAMTAWLG